MARTKTAPATRPPADSESVPADMFDRVTRALNVAYHEWRPGSDRIHTSPALVEQFGLDPDTFSVTRLLELIHPDDVAGYRADMTAFLKSGADRAESTYRVEGENGEYRWARSQYLAERDAEGRAVRVVGAVSDVTESKQREAENRALIARQAASIEVLKTISASPDDPQPVFELIAQRACELCNAGWASVTENDGAQLHLRALHGYDPAAAEQVRRTFPRTSGSDTVQGHVAQSGQIVHYRDVSIEHHERPAVSGVAQALRELAIGQGVRSILGVPLLRDGRVIGTVLLRRTEAGGFDDSEIALVESFAEQAVIAIASATTLRELRARTKELTESLDQQTATADVLRIISRSAFELDPVFQAAVSTAVRLCHADQAAIYRYQDGEFRWAAGHSLAPEYERIERKVRIRPGIGTLVGRVALEGRTVQILDSQADPLYEVKEDARVGGVRTILGVPLLQDGVAIGVFGLARRRVEPYTDRQIELVETFAEQAVIAIGSAATFNALQERTAELTRSVAELQALEEVLRAVNSSLELETVLATIISRAVQLSQADEGTIYEFDELEKVFLPRAAYGMSEDRIAWLRQRKVRLGETHLGRSAVERAPVHIADLQRDASGSDLAEVLRGIHAVLAVPLLREDKVIGGLVIRRRREGAFPPTIVTLIKTFAAQSVLAIENARLFQQAGQARTAAEAALADLHRAQDRLVQTEKMASLGQLTAGIAHEIKNPLNFVNNFSDLSVDLLDELLATLAPDQLAVAAGARADIDDITATLKSNLRKITEHGRRADAIVKNMLLHSREGSGERRAVDLNATVEEALNLAYHGARAEQPAFNISLRRQFDPAAGSLDIYPQEFTRVLLNLFSNGFYAAASKQAGGADPAFEPILTVTTAAHPDNVEIRVRDNGTGIPDHVRTKMFEPFFTTKPAGEGTGLGLSLSHDIIVKQHGGAITVESCPGEYTEFTVTLPRAAAGALP